MKYTDEQKRILSLCRKYKGMKCTFHKNFKGFAIFKDGVNPNWIVPFQDVEEWLSEHATPKTVGRPKGSVKPRGKVKRDISLSADQWSKVEEIRKTQGLKYTSHAIGLAVEAFSKNKTAYEIQSQIGND